MTLYTAFSIIRIVRNCGRSWNILPADTASICISYLHTDNKPAAYTLSVGLFAMGATLHWIMLFLCLSLEFILRKWSAGINVLTTLADSKTHARIYHLLKIKNRA